jgi:hypothetical protein
MFSEATASIVQMSLAAIEVGSRPWHYPCDSGFAVTQNGGVTASQKLPNRF